MQGFGKRTCMNTQIQGCASDALKLMIVRLWKDLFTKYADKGVRWIGTIHDEINYVCPKALLSEVVPIIMKCQTIQLPDWPVTLLPDLSIGTSFGSLIPFDYTVNADGSVSFTPQMEDLSNNHNKEPEPSEEYIPEIEDDYDYLQ